MNPTYPSNELARMPADGPRLSARDVARDVDRVERIFSSPIRGIGYLEQIVRGLSPAEVEDRARFAYEACVVMRERLVAVEVFDDFGWDREEARSRVLESQIMQMFRHSLFERIIPNLGRVGLLTESVRPLYEKMGVLDFEHSPDDGVIDRAVLAPHAGRTNFARIET